MSRGRMHADEVDIDESLVRSLLAAQFPQWADLPLVRVRSEGTDNAIYRLGSDLAVRLPRVGWATGQVVKEAHWLPRLAPALPLAVPVPIATGVPGAGYPWDWSIVPWLEDEDATTAYVADTNQLARDLGAFASALHLIDATGGPPASPANFLRGVPLASLDIQTRDQIAALGDTIDGPGILAVWESALAAPAWDRPPVWVHGDLLPGNLLLRDGALHAVIDYGCLGVGDPACDLIPAWYLFSGESRQVFRRSARVDKATWIRAGGWVVRAVGGLAYYAKTNPNFVTRARHALDEVVSDFRAT